MQMAWSLFGKFVENCNSEYVPMRKILYVSSTHFMHNSGAIENNAYFYGTSTFYGVVWHGVVCEQRFPNV